MPADKKGVAEGKTFEKPIFYLTFAARKKPKMIILKYFIEVVLSFLFCMLVYRTFNKGLSSSAIHQQRSRYLLTALVAWLPVNLAGASLLSAPIILAAATAMLWIVTYPALFYLTNRRRTSDIDNFMDGAFGLYVWGALSGLIVLGQRFLPHLSGLWVPMVSLLEFILLFLPLFQMVYYRLYHVCIDANGMKILQDSHINEVLEFGKSFPWWGTLSIVLLVLGVFCGTLLANFSTAGVPAFGWLQTVIIAGVLLFIFLYVPKRRHGVFFRTGLMELFCNVREYAHNNRRYVSEMQQRTKDLVVKPLGAAPQKPSTFLMVIGESASRDYMSAFTPMENDTTPWLNRQKSDTQHFILFPNAFSCAMHTVQTLEKSLTEYNQYNGGQFYSSCSIIDVAHKLGMHVHWYSNQGHLGSFDTPITLVAETSDVARWTKQEVGKVQYDESLLSFLDEVNPEVNNFVVLHLKGSHFNYENRYPKAFARWAEEGHENHLLSYENSLLYTDDVLRRAYDYCRERLNLQAMLYFSDHAALPLGRRTPDFRDFGMTHIPMFIYLSDEYRKLHPLRAEALRLNRNRYFTNDLAYELMCGLFDIESNHFDEANSLASTAYKYSARDLLTSEGRVRLTEDPSIPADAE